jgi:hypothetical protein
MPEVVVSRSVRVNLGDFQGTELFVSMKDESDEPVKAQRRLRRLVDQALIADLQRHFKARGKPISVEAICKRYGFSKE